MTPAAVVTVLMLLAAGPAASAGWIEDRPDGTTIIHVTVWLMPRPSDTDTYTRAELAGIRAFRQRFPAIFAERYRDRYKADPHTFGRHNWDRVEIELHQFSGITVEGVETDLLAIAGKTAPDVLYVNFRKSDNYIQNGFLYPLDKPEDGYLAAMTKEEIDFRVHEKIWPVIRRKGPGGVKHVWAMPYGGALGKVLLYRKDLFDEKGVPYPTADWTWEDLYSAARKLTDPKRGIYGILMWRMKHESWHWVTFLWSAGGEVMTYDEATDQWTCTFDSREAAVALDFYTRLNSEKWIDSEGKVRRGYAFRDSPDWQKWERGEIGMYFDYVGEKLFSRINPELTGMAPVPKGPTGKRGGELNSTMMGLFAGIADRVIRDAAWEYIRFYDCQESLRLKTAIMVEGGLGQFISPGYLRMFGYPEVERLAPRGWAENSRIAIETGRPEPYGRNCNYAYDLMTYPIEEAERLSVADGLPEDPQARLGLLQGILGRYNARANEEMLGRIPAPERRRRDWMAAGALAAIGLAFFFGLRYVIRSFAPPRMVAGRQVRWGFRRYAWAYLLLLPAVLTIILWQYVPLARGSIMAFQDYRLMGDSSWAGLSNFGDLLMDEFWWRSVWNALRYCALVIALTFLPPIVLAVLLQEVPRGKLLFRVIFYLPAVITGLVTVLLWKQFYEPSEYGALNALVVRIPAIGFLAVGAGLLLVAGLFVRRMLYHRMWLPAALFALGGLVAFWGCGWLAWPILLPPGEGLRQGLAHLWGRLLDCAPEPFRWLGNPQTAMLSLVIPMVWAGMGPGCLIYLAALKGIPDDLYEAADLDGATFVDKVLFVIFPILKPLIVINFVGTFIGSWYAGTANVLAMTGGAADTDIAGLHIFYKAFIYHKFGPATAMAWVLAFLLIGFTVHQLRILSRLEFRTTGDAR